MVRPTSLSKIISLHFEKFLRSFEWCFDGNVELPEQIFSYLSETVEIDSLCRTVDCGASLQSYCNCFSENFTLWMCNVLECCLTLDPYLLGWDFRQRGSTSSIFQNRRNWIKLKMADLRYLKKKNCFVLFTVLAGSRTFFFSKVLLDNMRPRKIKTKKRATQRSGLKLYTSEQRFAFALENLFLSLMNGGKKIKLLHSPHTLIVRIYFTYYTPPLCQIIRIHTSVHNPLFV